VSLPGHNKITFPSSTTLVFILLSPLLTALHPNHLPLPNTSIPWYIVHVNEIAPAGLNVNKSHYAIFCQLATFKSVMSAAYLIKNMHTFLALKITLKTAAY
jgi:hypothetical protein